MDRRVSVDEWLATMPIPANSVYNLPTLLDRLASATRRLKHSPYDPQGWLARARCLIDLECPELAAGDLVRGYSLVRNILRVRKSNDNYQLGVRCGFWLMNETEQTTESYSDLKIRFGATKLAVKNLLYDESDAQNTVVQRSFVPRGYPWIARHHRCRSDDLIRTINGELERSCHQVTGRNDGTTCTIRREAFDAINADPQEILGIFATQNIRAGTLLFVDNTTTVGCGMKPSINPEHDIQACRTHRNPALDWIGEKLEYERATADAVLFCLFLSECISRPAPDDQSPATFIDPFDHPLIARLTASYYGMTHKTQPSQQLHRSSFSVTNDIRIPWQLLEQHGIDIYTDGRFDTWVLFTLRARIRTNQWGDAGFHVGVHPLFSFFNHSCQPNVSWNFPIDANTPRFLQLTAREDIAVGEQLFVNYDQYTESMGLAERRVKLWRWLGGPCVCRRCQREEREERARVEDHGDRMIEDVNSWDVDAAERPTLPPTDEDVVMEDTRTRYDDGQE